MFRLACAFCILALAFPAAIFGQNDTPTLNEQLRRLRDPDREKRLEAFEDRYIYGSKYAALAPALATFLNDPDEDVRQQAANKLADLGPLARPALDALRAKLDDDSRIVRASVAAAIWTISGDSERSLPVLVDAVRDAEVAADTRATVALADMARTQQAAIEPLVGVLRSPKFDRSDRELAASALGETDLLTDKTVRPALRHALEDKDPLVSLAAAAALWRLGTPTGDVLDSIVKAGIQQDSDQQERDEGLPLVEREEAKEVARIIVEIGPEAKGAIPILVELIESGRVQIGVEAADALGAVGPEARTAIQALMAAFQKTTAESLPFVHRSWCLSDNAAEALRRLGPESVPIFLAALDSDDARLRLNAANQLQWFPDQAEAIVPALLKRVGDPAIEVRAAVAFTLGAFGPAGRATGPALAGDLNQNGDWSSFPAGSGIGVRHSLTDQLAASLIAIDADPETVVPELVMAMEQSHLVSPAMVRVLRYFGPRATLAAPVLEQLLENQKQRVHAARALAAIRPDDARYVAVLVEALGGPELVFDSYAALCLAELGNRSSAALPQLQALLAGSELRPEARAILAAAVLRIDPQDDRAVLQLAEALRDVVPFMQYRDETTEEATATWKQLGERALPAVPLLIAGMEVRNYSDERMHNMDDQYDQRLRCARLLAAIPSKAATPVPALIEVCQLGHTPSQCEAIDLLGEIGPPAADAVPALVELLANDEAFIFGGDFYGNGGTWRHVGDRATLALGQIGPAAAPALRTALSSVERPVRRRAAEALGRIGPAAADSRHDLLAALSDQSPFVRAAAAEALGQIGGDADTVVPALAVVLRDPRLEPRQSAAAALSRYGAAAATAVDDLTTALADACLPARIAAARALGAIGPAARSASPAFRRMLTEEFPAAQAAAREALEKIGQ